MRLSKMRLSSTRSRRSELRRSGGARMRKRAASSDSAQEASGKRFVEVATPKICSSPRSSKRRTHIASRDSAAAETARARARAAPAQTGGGPARGLATSCLAPPNIVLSRPASARTALLSHPRALGP